MGKQPRRKPQRLAEKLLQIRKTLNLSQSQIGRLLGLTGSFHRISQYESGEREPDLITLLQYARAGRTTIEALVDDRIMDHRKPRQPASYTQRANGTPDTRLVDEHGERLYPGRTIDPTGRL